MPTTSRRLAPIIAAIPIIFLAACGGPAPTVSPGTVPDTVSPAPTSDVAGATGPAASPAGPAASPGGPATSPEAGGNGQGTGSEACDVLPAETVGQVLDETGVTIEPTPADGGDFSYCNYLAPDGQSLMATSYTTTQSAAFDAYKSAEGTVTIPGIGDEAIWADGLLMVRQGDSILTIQPSATLELSEDELLAALTELAGNATANM